jgi:hypothetical protein
MIDASDEPIQPTAGEVMSERLTMDEIAARYPDEWVFIEDPVSNEWCEVQSGILRFHSKDQSEVDRAALALQPRPRRSAFLYTGTTDDDEIVIL